MAKIGTVLSAIMASSCCWLPPILILMGVSGAGMIAALEEYRPLFMIVTFGFLAMAFYFTYRPRRARAGAGAADCCQAQRAPRRFSMMAMNKIMLWAVAAMAVAFLFFPQFFTSLFVGGNETITSDMTRTVIKVEGMTCEG